MKKKEKRFIQLAGILFLLVGILHFIRSVFSWQMIIGNFMVPLWWSYLLFIFLGFMSYLALKLNK